VRLLTVGHGTASQDEFSALLRDAEVAALVDVRRVPASRRSPHFRRAELAEWLPANGVGYRWEPDLGGFRKSSGDSPNVALRNPSFRAYADYMSTDQFRAALDRVLAEAAGQVTVVMCSETLWWRCHRRLIADAATLLREAEVLHLGHDGRLSPHQPTAGVRRGPGDSLRYDSGQSMLPGAGV
jgi:uncharacterized protein (DUF488 family)